MKQMDVRNIKALVKVVDEGEAITARQALDRLVEYRIKTGGSITFVPNVGRLTSIMKRSEEFVVAPKSRPSATTTFMLAEGVKA